MKRNLNVSFALAVAATLVVLIANPAYAGNCPNLNATLNGNYGFISPGFISTGKGLSQDVGLAVVGVFAFDGNGDVPEETHTVSVNGGIAQRTGNSGTYNVSSDCTGSISLTAGPNAGVTFNIVVIGGGTEIFGIQTNSGSISTLGFKKE